jgi:GWxTD domain-containing protein
MAKMRINFLVLLFLAQINVLAQNKVSNIDLSYRYQEKGGITGKILGIREDSVAVLLVKVDQSLDSLRRFKLTYSLANSLEDDISTKYKLSTLSTYFQYEDQASAYFGIRAKVRNFRYIILWLEDTTKYIRYPLIKDLNISRNVGEIAMYRLNFNAPIISSYLPVKTSVRLRPLDGTLRNLTVKYYDHNFLPAPPPMTRAEEGTEERFSADNQFETSTNDTIAFENPGLYYFELNGAKVGQSVIITDEQYPSTNSFDELVKNLRYLATEEEYEKMSTSFNKKELFDKFWLNNTKAEDRAKEAVRAYYKRVRRANELFTSYKEGWKTDRGMIYIVFGPPSRVFITDKSEMWIYEKSFELPRVSFTFARIDTAFTNVHYVLLRNAEYQNLWYRVVDLWRKGKKEY